MNPERSPASKPTTRFSLVCRALSDTQIQVFNIKNLTSKETNRGTIVFIDPLMTNAGLTYGRNIGLILVTEFTVFKSQSSQISDKRIESYYWSPKPNR